MKNKEIRAILDSYFAPLPDGVEHSVQKYIDLLDTWGRKMPLTSIRDHEEIVRFHFGESIFAVSLGKMTSGRLADVGSGAGFPGLALKLVEPSISLTLIESNKKKCAFLHEVVRALDLKGTEIISSVFESSPLRSGSLSFVTSRALGHHSDIVDWTRDKLEPAGSILLWVTGSDCKTLATRDGWRWQAPALIPGTRERFVLQGSPIP
ncbi:MAG: 16S rRNA (guanine(527)-N(7))-methyltransferase RsmG [Candidatus Acidiferrales bacterium]